MEMYQKLSMLIGVAGWYMVQEPSSEADSDGHSSEGGLIGTGKATRPPLSIRI